MTDVEGDSGTPKGLIASAQRVLHVLEVVAEAGDGVTAKAISRRSGINLSTTYQLINTLVHEGYLVRLRNSGGYGVGYKVFDLHRHLTTELSAVPSIYTVLREMHPRARAPLYFTIFRDTQLVVAEVADSPEYPRAADVDAGFIEATHSTAYGTLLLAALPPLARDQYLQKAGLSSAAKRSEIEGRLEQVRLAGVALEIEEFQPGLTCMAVPVSDASGTVRGAIASSGPTADFLPRRWEIERVVRSTAARVSRLLAMSSAADADAATEV